MQKTLRVALSAAVLVSAAACSQGSEISAPVSAFPGSAAELVGDRNDVYGVQLGVVNVCVFYTGLIGPGPTSTLSATATGGDVIQGNFGIAPPPHCIEVWNAESGDVVTVSASLISAGLGWEIERIYRAVGDGITPTSAEWLYGVSSAAVNVSDATGAFIWFKMKASDVPPPPQGGQGCTPGYWRQSQHFDSWTSPYAPTTLFDDVFADAFPGKTLLDVVWMGGGGVNALGRHAVAALLNGASTDVSYDLSTARVISGFNAAFASGSKSVMNDRKNVFEMLNEQGCPLN